jgi:threonine/homoserine/homoserine lactone efflux protein
MSISAAICSWRAVIDEVASKRNAAGACDSRHCDLANFENVKRGLDYAGVESEHSLSSGPYVIPLIGIPPKQSGSMLVGSLLAFLGVSLVVIATPGPDTAITIRNTLFGGRSGGVLTALGIATGQTIWAGATSAGIVAALIASQPLFLAVKYAGGAYLIYLGIRALREAIRPSAPVRANLPAAGSAPRLTPLSAFQQGVISDLSNPKMAVFFVSLLPQFILSGDATFSRFLLLGIVFACMTFIWLALYAAFVSSAAHLLHRPSIRRLLEGATGIVLIGLGLRIAAETR